MIYEKTNTNNYHLTLFRSEFPKFVSDIFVLCIFLENISIKRFPHEQTVSHVTWEIPDHYNEFEIINKLISLNCKLNIK